MDTQTAAPTRARRGETALIAEHDASAAEPKMRYELRVELLAYPKGGRWYAECTDLAIQAVGATEEEAFGCLMEQLVSYVRTAISRGWLDQLHRPTSWRHRLEVRLRVALAKLRRQPALVRTKLLTV
jgi:hypothetical protein